MQTKNIYGIKLHYICINFTQLLIGLMYIISGRNAIGFFLFSKIYTYCILIVLHFYLK